MSFGGGGFGGGFGSTNNQQSSGFGGFGSSTAGGFGQQQQQQQQQQSTGFGANPAGGGNQLFGGGGGSGFGSGTSGFGTSKPFGSTTGGGLFGSTQSSSSGTGFGSGGFGSTQASTTGTGFGSSATGSTLFGSGNKPGFGTGSSTGGGLFGGASTTTGGGFGSSSTPSGGGLFGNSQNTQECQGTGSTPFTAYAEKEPNSQVTNHYQSITFMQPYQKWGFEELRLADYNAGRRFGNGSGQAGAFGTSTGFGGFGQQNTQPASTGFGASTGGGLFGQQSSSGGFGSTTQTTGGFGSGAAAGSTGSGLFGQQNKPAGGLFGSTATTTASTGGGLFGTAGGTGFGAQQQPQQGTGFGSGTGSSLFGGNQNQQKAGFSFGQNNATSAAGGGFGGGFGATTGSAGGGLFGNNQNQNQGGSLFGNNQQQASGGLFGQQQQNQTQNQSQGSGFGGFGQNNQQKPGGLFGNTTSTAGGGLFGQNQNSQQQQGGTGLFGQSGNTGGGLFGQKPAQSGGNLFGQNPGASSGGGLFGNNQNQQQQNQGGGLFGGASNTGGNSLFGQKPAQSGTGLFGNTQQQGQGGGLFGSQNNQAQNNAFSLGGANNSTNSFGAQQNALQGPPALTASASDLNPYGSASIFSGLPQPSQQSPGPVATPISAGQKQKKPAALPQFKINPAMASRFATPQRRGYGFTYSTYGTPSSASSVASSPGGLGSSLIASSLGRSLGKSFSASNLRRTFDTDGENILAPGAFSANSSRYGTGSLKKLNIDRSLRTDLFGTQPVAALPAPERNEPSRSPAIKKKVSFDTSITGGNGSTNGTTDEDGSNPSAQEQGFYRSRSNGGNNGRSSLGGHGSPTKDPNQNKELTTVHEDGSPQASNNNALVVREQDDPEPGDYWTRPAIAELKSWPRDSLKSVQGFEVGRDSCGSVTFEEPVDLTGVDLESICGHIVVIELRSLTVYPTTVEKPPVGQGLNVPSLIALENSWPRQRDKKTPLFEKSGPRFDKHVKRLASVIDTTFVAYEENTGIWRFRVAHFTTYGYDYDDDTTEQSDVDLSASILSEAQSVETPTPAAKLSGGRLSSKRNAISSSSESSEPDDTFDFKKKLVPPGSFDPVLPFDNEVEMEEVTRNGESFLGERSVVLDSDEEQDEPSEPQAMVMQEKVLVLRRDSQPDDIGDVIGSFPTMDGLEDANFEADSEFSGDGGQRKTLIDEDIDWMEQLQRTVSPRKQDRHALRQSQAAFLKDHPHDFGSTIPVKEIAGTGEIATSIDLMNSLFGKEEARRNQSQSTPRGGAKAFKWPYPKPTPTEPTTQSESDREFHASFKPSWSPRHRLTYVTHDGPNAVPRDIRTMKFEKAKDVTAARFQQQRAQTKFLLEQGVPKAVAYLESFAADDTESRAVAAHSHENFIWELLGILFDEYTDDLSSMIPEEVRPQFSDRIRKDRLSTFWARICEEDALKAVAAAQTNEERAIAYLSAHRVPEACAALIDGKNFRLATLVAQIGEDQGMHDDMSAQIEEWRKLNVLSEITEPIRTLYELLAGNTCTSVGKRGPVEDRAETFVISERFNMDWKRAFGLRLWYGIRNDEPLEVAVRRYAADLQEADLRKPLPFFLLDSNISLPWRDPNAAQRQDVLWGLLELFSRKSTVTGSAPDLAQVLMPENTIGLPMFHRLSFELYRAVAPNFVEQASPPLGDELTVSFATELEAVNQWLWAVFVSLHLSDARSRRKAVQALLARHAGVLHQSNNKAWSTLVDEFKIPEQWLWEAMALFARANPDISPDVALRYLLKANDVEEAHRVLLETVAPLKIVERDYDGLQVFLNEFDTLKPKAWDRGGGVFADFVHLLQGGMNKKEKRSLVSKLVRGLADTEDGALMGKSAEASDAGFLRRVAVREMSHVVGNMLLDDVGGDAKEQVSILQLPLNPETKASRARDLSWSHYRKIMAAGG